MSWKKKNREEFRKEKNQGKSEEKKKKDKAIGRKAKNAIVVVVLFALALLSLVAFFGKAGIIGMRFVQSIGWLLGVGKFSIPLFFFIGAFSIIRRFKKPLWVTLLGMFLLIFSFSSLVGALFHSGGAMGNTLGGLAVRYLDKVGATIVLVAFFLVSSILALNLSFGFLFKKDKDEETQGGEQKDQQRQPELGLDEKKESIFGKFADKKPETKILRHPIFRLRGLSENKKETKEGTEVKTVAIDMKEEGYVFPTLDLLSLELLDKEGVQKPEINQNIEIKLVIKNVGGNLTSESGLRNIVFTGTDWTTTNVSHPDYPSTVKPLQNGQSFEVTYTGKFVASGEKNFTAKVDEPSEVLEINEKNNSYSEKVAAYAN